MDAATLHALILAAAGTVACLVAHALLRKRHARHQEPAPAGPRPDALPTEDLSRELQRLYARKTVLRLGVFAGCVLALAVYVLGWGRAWALLPLVAAAVCQYGVYRQKTTTRLMELMQRRASGPGAGMAASGQQ